MIKNQRYFYINSRNRSEGTDEYFYIDLPLPPNHDWTHAVVTAAIIPKSYYLVEAKRNTFDYKEDAKTTTITIPPGNYGMSSFARVVSKLLSENSPNSLTYKMTTSREPDTCKYTFTAFGDNLPNQISFDFHDNNLFEQFGFEHDSTPSFTLHDDQFILTSENVVKFAIEDALYLRSDLTGNEHDNVLQQIYVSTADFSNINYLCPDINLHAKKIVKRSGTRFFFSLTDEDGQVLSLNGLNMNLTIMLFTQSQ
jgi:hypothetical protein